MGSISEATRTTLTSLSAYWLAFWALAGAISAATDATVDMDEVRLLLAGGWLAAGLAYLGARLAPPRARVPVLTVITVGLAAGTVLAAALSGLVSPWVQITMVAGMLLTLVGFTARAGLLVPAAIAVVVLVLAPQRMADMLRENSPVQLGVPLMLVVLVVGLGLLAAMIRAVLLRAAEQADRTMQHEASQRRAALEERSREHALSTQMALLHDTALNTLAAIALTRRQSKDELRRRCAEDAARLTQVDAQAPTRVAAQSVLDRAQACARSLGVTLAVDVDERSDLRATMPRTVAEACAGALDEALLNVSKHADVPNAHLRLVADGTQLRATLTDAGPGFDPASTPVGLGVTRSIVERMAAVGAAASVRSSPGTGTTVELAWAAPSRASEQVDDVVSAAVRQMLAAALVASTVFTTAVVVVEWQAFERPQVALVGSLVLGAWGLAVIWLLRRTRWIPVPIAVVTVALACVAHFWTIPADEFCSSSFAGIGWVDPRVVLVVVVMLTARRWWWAAAAAVPFVASALVAGSLWGEVFSGCDMWAVTAAMGSVAILGASLLAGRTLARQTRAVVTANVARTEAEDDSLRAAAARAEQQDWFRPAVSSCIPLLAAIGAGRADPACDEVRERCGLESDYLRGLVTVARAPVGVRDALRDMLQVAHAAGLHIEVRGDVAALPPPSRDLDGVLADVVADSLAGATAMVITALAEPTAGTVMVHLPGGPPPAAGTTTLGPVTVVVDDIDGCWVEVTWTADRAGQPAGRPPRAMSTHTPAPPVGSR